MAKFIHLYETEAAFRTAYYGEDYAEPWVSYTDTQDSHVNYNKKMPYVDLGLPSGNLWAEYNLGASSDSEPGNYYAWGELVTKSEYSRDTYKYYDDSVPMYTKYNSLNSRFLDNDDDTAHATLGGNWYMPTPTDLNELHNNCTITQVQEGGQQYKVYTSNINGNSIRFVEGGYFSGTSLAFTNHFYFWLAGEAIDQSTTPNFEYVMCEYGAFNGETYFGTSEPRYCGLNIRPVLKPSAS